MSTCALRASWIIEFDYNADPETAPAAVHQAVVDQLSVADHGSVANNIVVVERMCDAFALKKLLGHHIVRVERTEIALDTSD